MQSLCKQEENFCKMRTISHWNTLPREEVDSSALDAFKTRLDSVLGHLLSREVVPDDPEVSSNLILYDVLERS